MTPKTFWGYRLQEWHYAIDGHIASKGGNTDNPEALDRSSLEDLMEKYPDVPRDPT